jgi:dipeptidyl aminopeptidase/acylaminoacyl peptidase
MTGIDRLFFGHYNRSPGYNHFVHHNLIVIHCSLLASLFACSTPPQARSEVEFSVFRFEPPALVELSADDQPLREIPMATPAGCGLDNLFPSPRGASMAIEWNCSSGKTVVVLNTDTREFKQTVTDSDSHFLAWAPDGESLYLKVNTINHPQILRVHLDGRRDTLPITELTYDLAPDPNGSGFISSFSRGMGFGSEMDMARSDGRNVKQLMADPQFYLSFSRWSPDGKQIAFIKIPDSQTPFTIGELWLMSADGSNAHKLADADSGHGFAPAWSPDGTRLAFVVRDNPADPAADQSAAALISNIHVVNVASGAEAPLTKFNSANVGTPVWSLDGKQVAITLVMNDKMNVVLIDAASGETRQVLAVSACCSAWIRK